MVVHCRCNSISLFTLLNGFVAAGQKLIYHLIRTLFRCTFVAEAHILYYWSEIYRCSPNRFHWRELIFSTLKQRIILKFLRVSFEAKTKIFELQIKYSILARVEPFTHVKVKTTSHHLPT